ncbi:kelch-like protein 33 [Dromiciops gliroides]|uniref:kelch-like protein 33 n=1 Tax=Dromiciops gliroides TaxID=33562 RepID=UPI001CC7AAC7|nr:kelch-like protein 33 [Dromiciops gliroides]XP_043836289.1 kelch-like protein 33 [Dromiciops gliroides]
MSSPGTGICCPEEGLLSPQSQKDYPNFELPARQSPTWPSSPDEDLGLLPFPVEEPGLRASAPGDLPSPALSLEEEEEEDEGEPEVLVSEEHPGQFFAEARRLRDSSLLLDEEVIVQGRRYAVHGVVLASVSSLFRSRLLRNGGPRAPLELDIAPKGWEAVLTFAYEGVVGPAALGDVVAVAEVLGAPRVAAAALRRLEADRNQGAKEQEGPDKTEELRESLNSIERLYREGVGCDLELEAEGCHLKVHRVALVCGSEFFGAMLLSGMRESQGSAVVLYTVSAPDLQLLVSFAYAGALQTNWSGLLRATQAALQYQSGSCLALCQKALARGLSPLRCLSLLPVAEAPGLERLWDKVHYYLLTHLPAVASCPTFPDLPPPFLANLLASDELHIEEEFEAFEAAWRWLAADPVGREPEAETLLRCVRFGRMSTRELRRVRAAGLPQPLPSSLLHQILIEAEVPGRERRREPNRALVVIGGDGLTPDLAQSRPSRGVWWARAFCSGVGLVHTVEWGKLPALPAPGRFRHGAASLTGTELYVCGGQHYYSHSDTLASVLRWAPGQGNWEELAPMCQARSFFPLVAHDGHLYALGGRDKGDALDSVEAYDPKLDVWRTAPSLPTPCFAHAASVLDGQVYVSGGYTGTSQYLACLFNYNPTRKPSWILLSPMKTPRAGHVMVALGGRLYVAGGLGEAGDLLSFEVYDPRTDTWMSLEPLPSPHVGAAGVSLQGEMLVLGGYSYRTYALSHLIHSYNPGLGRWLCLGALPRPRAEMSACVLRLSPV